MAYYNDYALIGRINRPTNDNALIKRINRALAKQRRKLRTARQRHPLPRWHGHGRYYVINEINSIVDPNVDLERLGRDLGVLTPLEIEDRRLIDYCNQ